MAPGTHPATSSRRRRLAEIGRQDRLAGVFIMGVAGLNLLRDRVHVAEAPFERILGEHRGRARHVIGGVDDSSALVDSPGRGDADRNAAGLVNSLAVLKV